MVAIAQKIVTQSSTSKSSNSTTLFAMGRIRTKTKKTVPVVSSASDTPSKSTSTPTIPALLEKAQELIIQCDYGLARLFIKRVLDREPAHVDAREMMGIILLEMGEINDARSVSQLYMVKF